MEATTRDMREYLDALGYDSAVVQRIQSRGWVKPETQAPGFDIEHWEKLKLHALSCTACPLSKERKNVVFGRGNTAAKLMFVGEGPGYHEDQKGLPFVGKAGALLDKMIEAMGFSIEDIYIANVVKCRPPDNRNPEPAEIEQCSPFLKDQIEQISPQIVVALGKFAAQFLLQSTVNISQLRGKFHNMALEGLEKIQVMPTYHPAFLLRNPEFKRAAWSDLQIVMKELD